MFAGCSLTAPPPLLPPLSPPSAGFPPPELLEPPQPVIPSAAENKMAHPAFEPHDLLVVICIVLSFILGCISPEHAGARSIIGSVVSFRKNVSFVMFV